MFARSSVNQLKWVLFGKEAERLSFVQAKIDNEWEAHNMDLAKWWELTESQAKPLAVG